MAQGKQLQRYMVRHSDGSRSGPLNAQALRSLAANGTIGRDDQIQKVGNDEWHRASTIQGLQFASSPTRHGSTSPASRKSRGGRVALMISTAIVVLLGVAIIFEELGRQTESGHESNVAESVEAEISGRPLESSAEVAADALQAFATCLSANARSVANAMFPEARAGTGEPVFMLSGELTFEGIDILRSASALRDFDGTVDGQWESGAFGTYDIKLTCAWNGQEWSFEDVEATYSHGGSLVPRQRRDLFVQQQEDVRGFLDRFISQIARDHCQR